MLVFGFAIASVTANACGLAPSCSTYGRRSSQVGGVGSIPFTVMSGWTARVSEYGRFSWSGFSPLIHRLLFYICDAMFLPAASRRVVNARLLRYCARCSIPRYPIAVRLNSTTSPAPPSVPESVANPTSDSNTAPPPPATTSYVSITAFVTLPRCLMLTAQARTIDVFSGRSA